MIIPAFVADVHSEQSNICTYFSPMIAGAAAGVTMVTAIYPLDTLKTRLQAGVGFRKAGGFQGIYKGFMTIALGAVPINSVFFGSYEALKQLCEPLVTPQHVYVVHMCSASFCRGLSSLIRVPVEVAKQRQQVYFGSNRLSALSILIDAYRKEGFNRGLYRGLASTLMRDMPFSFIQIPIWELLRSSVRPYTNKKTTSFQSAMCGLAASAVAAALTTPLDVVKTRIMLADVGGVPYHNLRVRVVLNGIYSESGLRGLFKGVGTRMAMITIGGFIFFGVYDAMKGYIEDYSYRPG